MKKSIFKKENSHHSEGISLISLIITIIVIFTYSSSVESIILRTSLSFIFYLIPNLFLIIS